MSRRNRNHGEATSKLLHKRKMAKCQGFIMKVARWRFFKLVLENKRSWGNDNAWKVHDGLWSNDKPGNLISHRFYVKDSLQSYFLLQKYISIYLWHLGTIAIPIFF